MTLVIYDFQGRYYVGEIGELEAILGKRYGHGVNGFWFSHDDEAYPTICLLVIGDLSTLLYVPREGHPGFAPVGRIPDLDKDGDTVFRVDSVEQELVVTVRL